MKPDQKTFLALAGIFLLFLALAAGFALNLWGQTAPIPPIAPVDPSITSTATVRNSYAELIRTGADVSDFDCYVCHEKGKPVALTFDENHNLVVPTEHSDVVMGHGRNNRNNLCYNCHDENNLELFQTRDGRELKLTDSTPLCGSCHGPTYRDWDAGAHGRVSGFWDQAMGPKTRQDCVSCHNPHSPKFPGRKPGPPPHPLRPLQKPVAANEGEH
jgi:hypothetical protein